MKKIILSLAILLASSTTISAFAQAPADKTPTVVGMKSPKKGGERKQAPNPFEGLNLTDQQKAQLKDLKMGPTKEQRLQEKTQEKARKQQKAQERKQARRDYLAKVKAILTPEQYVEFLENNFVDKADMKKGPRKGGKDFCKGHKKCHKGQGPRKGDGKKGQKQGRPDGKQLNKDGKQAKKADKK